MAPSNPSETIRGDSPDPSSHAANIYDAEGAEGEWLDETDDDDDMYEPTTDESEDAEFFDPSEDVEADFHGNVLSDSRRYLEKLVIAMPLNGSQLLMFNGLICRCRGWYERR